MLTLGRTRAPKTQPTTRLTVTLGTMLAALGSAGPGQPWKMTSFPPIGLEDIFQAVLVLRMAGEMHSRLNPVDDDPGNSTRRSSSRALVTPGWRVLVISSIDGEPRSNLSPGSAGSEKAPSSDATPAAPAQQD